jgi:hypothetical protein
LNPAWLLRRATCLGAPRLRGRMVMGDEPTTAEIEHQKAVARTGRPLERDIVEAAKSAGRCGLARLAGGKGRNLMVTPSPSPMYS